MAKSKKSTTPNAASVAGKVETMAREQLETVQGATSEYGAGEVYLLPVAKVWYETDKSAVDYDPRVERELSPTFVEGVTREGVIESITVREATNPANPAQTLKIVNGKTRFRAALKAGLALIKGGIVTADARKALELQVMLNAHRFADESDLQCDNAKRLHAQGYTPAAIADLFNMPLSTAVNTLKIVERVPDVAESPHLSFAAKEELARRAPDVATAALEVAESLAKAAEASTDGKVSAGFAKNAEGKPSRKADASVKETKDGRKVGQASHSAVKGIADEIEGKPPAAPAKSAKADKPAAAPKVAAKDTRADANTLRAKATRALMVARSAAGESVASEAQRAFAAGVQAALFFAAGDSLDKLPAPCTTKEAREAVKAALAILFKDAAVESESAAA